MLLLVLVLAQRASSTRSTKARRGRHGSASLQRATQNTRRQRRPPRKRTASAGRGLRTTRFEPRRTPPSVTRAALVQHGRGRGGPPEFQGARPASRVSARARVESTRARRTTRRPRAQLLEELENFDKARGDMTISCGLKDPSDIFLTTWQASIIGPPGTRFDNNIYGLEVVCGADYPRVPPEVYFQTRVNLRGVDPRSGRVDLGALRANWRYDCTIATALGYVRQEMSKPASRNLPQPPEGETFPPRS